MSQALSVSTKELTTEQIELIKRTICKGASNDELQLFIHYCNKSGLDPLSRQIYAVQRWDSKLQKNIMAIQTSVDGFRVIAERSGVYEGQVGPFWCGEDGKWTDVWLKQECPHAAKVGVWKKGFREPTYGVATWAEYCQYDKKGAVAFMWQRMPNLMLSKVAESLALRKAFPHDLSGLYTQEEMAQSIVADDKTSSHDKLPVAEKKPEPHFAPNKDLQFDISEKQDLNSRLLAPPPVSNPPVKLVDCDPVITIGSLTGKKCSEVPLIQLKQVLKSMQDFLKDCEIGKAPPRLEDNISNIMSYMIGGKDAVSEG